MEAPGSRSPSLLPTRGHENTRASGEHRRLPPSEHDPDDVVGEGEVDEGGRQEDHEDPGGLGEAAST